MANGPDHHFHLLFGELGAMLAMARAENEALREELAATRKPVKTKTKTETKQP